MMHNSCLRAPLALPFPAPPARALPLALPSPSLPSATAFKCRSPSEGCRDVRRAGRGDGGCVGPWRGTGRLRREVAAAIRGDQGAATTAARGPGADEGGLVARVVRMKLEQGCGAPARSMRRVSSLPSTGLLVEVDLQLFGTWPYWQSLLLEMFVIQFHATRAPFQFKDNEMRVNLYHLVSGVNR
ncbi:hypothetical protein EJB05_48712, partial [Eragrostis curvula]